jgi:uncharacterized protein (TIGR03905 family)
MKLTFDTGGTCAERIDIEIKDGMIVATEFIGGHPGNPVVTELLAEGEAVTDVIKYLKGLACNGDSSCPGRLARALEKALG